jgi:hypothetical protein
MRSARKGIGVVLRQRRGIVVSSRRAACGLSTSLLASALVACVLAAPAAADNPPAPQPTGPSPQSLTDGCQRDPASLISGSSPEWTYVYNTPAAQAAPPARWVSGIASSNNAAFQAVHTSGADFAFGHDALDFNMNVLPESQYMYLLAGHPASGSNMATGSYSGDGEETNRLHTEYEDLTIPKFAWPEAGDRVTELGTWVWDCGHWGTPTNVFSPDYDLPHVGQPCPSPFAGDPSQCTITGERTEFHPYRALFDERAQSPNSLYGEGEAELLVSTDKTRAGKTADCAHKFPPPPSNQQPNPNPYPPSFDACLETEPNWQDVTGDYSFLLHAPPKPSADAKLVFRAVDEGSVGAPAPTLAEEGDGVRITFHLDSAPSQRLVMAYRIFAGWDAVPLADVPTHLRVAFDRLEIHRAMDPGCSINQPVPGCQFQSTRTNQGTTAPGDWNLYWDVNGIWGQWPPGEFLPNDGDSLSGTQSVDLYVPPGKGWRLFVHGRECDINDVDPARPLADCPTNREIADNNDVPGMILDTYASVASSLGTHRSNALTRRSDPTSTCPDDVSGSNPNPEGCYSLTYTVSVVNDAPSRVRAPYQVPGSASSVSVPLVPVFVQCGTAGNQPNAAHAPSLAVQSCDPPRPVSKVAAVGRQGQGSAQLTVVPDDSSTAANEGDLSFAGSLTDVRAGDERGADYDPSPGGPDLTIVGRWRVTDLANGPSQSAATAVDVDFPVPVDCSPTSAPSVGSSCSFNTTANAVSPGSVSAGQRAIVQLFRVRANDSGPDGVLGNADDKLFEQQGIFSP